MMRLAIVVLAVLLLVAVIWLFALDRTVANVLRRSEDLDRRLRDAGL
jgi:hypothetical protein